MMDAPPPQSNERQLSTVNIKLYLCMLLFSLSLLGGDTSPPSSETATGIRDHQWYTEMRAVLGGVSELGGCSVVGYKDTASYITEYPWLHEAYEVHFNQLAAKYSIRDDAILRGIQEAVYTEFFNSGRVHACVVDATISGEIKAQLNAVLQAHDERASHGLFNLKAYRLVRSVWESLPEDLKKTLPFDQEKDHISTEALVAYLTTGSLAEQFSKNLELYFAVAAANQKDIIDYSTINGYSPAEKQFIAGRIVCCSDPSIENSEAQEHFGFFLLHNPEEAKKYFEQVGLRKSEPVN